MDWQPSPFVPRAPFKGGHLQTVVSHFLRRHNALGRGQVEDVQVEPDVMVRCHVHLQPGHENAPTLFAVHGLEGSVDAQYVVGLANKAFAMRMNVVRMNVRNCGDSEPLSATLYHSGLSTDVGAVLRHVMHKFGLRDVGLVGYSMGGNLVLKLAGEWADNVPEGVVAVAAVSPAMDLNASSEALHEWENRIYEWFFLAGLSLRFLRKRRAFPAKFGDAPLLRVRSLKHFDDVIVAPHFGFDGAEHYYREAASARVLHAIRVPTLILHAWDDPFIRILPSTMDTIRANPDIRFVGVEHGGHCGFLEEPRHDDGRWAERESIAFILHARNHAR